MSNFTVFMLTGDRSSVISAIKDLTQSNKDFSAVITSQNSATQPPKQKSYNKITTKLYSADTFIGAKASLPSFQQKIANHFIASKKEIRFSDLKNHILRGNPTTFSNAALSNYLRANDFQRNVRHFPDKTTKIVWIKK